MTKYLFFSLHTVLHLYSFCVVLFHVLRKARQHISYFLSFKHVDKDYPTGSTGPNLSSKQQQLLCKELKFLVYKTHFRLLKACLAFLNP